MVTDIASLVLTKPIVVIFKYLLQATGWFADKTNRKIILLDDFIDLTVKAVIYEFQSKTHTIFRSSFVFSENVFISTTIFSFKAILRESFFQLIDRFNVEIFRITLTQDVFSSVS